MHLLVTLFLATLICSSLAKIELPEYVNKSATIPPQCRTQSTCPPYQEFLACSVYERGSCTIYCQQTVHNRAMELRSCSMVPSTVTVSSSMHRCISECIVARSAIEHARRVHKEQAHALIFSAAVLEKYSSGYKLFRPVRKAENPCKMVENTPKGKEYTAIVCAEETSMNCWFCKWTQTKCPSDCSKSKENFWDFQWEKWVWPSIFSIYLRITQDIFVENFVFLL